MYTVDTKFKLCVLTVFMHTVSTKFTLKGTVMPVRISRLAPRIRAVTVILVSCVCLPLENFLENLYPSPFREFIHVRIIFCSLCPSQAVEFFCFLCPTPAGEDMFLSPAGEFSVLCVLLRPENYLLLVSISSGRTFCPIQLLVSISSGKNSLPLSTLCVHL